MGLEPKITKRFKKLFRKAMVHTMTFKKRCNSRFKVGMTYHKCLGHNELKIHIKQQAKILEP